jgi:hypothetical protein
MNEAGKKILTDNHRRFMGEILTVKLVDWIAD